MFFVIFISSLIVGITNVIIRTSILKFNKLIKITIFFIKFTNNTNNIYKNDRILVLNIFHDLK